MRVRTVPPSFRGRAESARVVPGLPCRACAAPCLPARRPARRTMSADPHHSADLARCAECDTPGMRAGLVLPFTPA